MFMAVPGSDRGSIDFHDENGYKGQDSLAGDIIQCNNVGSNRIAVLFEDRPGHRRIAMYEQGSNGSGNFIGYRDV
jgi:hypothetical protein